MRWSPRGFYLTRSNRTRIAVAACSVPWTSAPTRRPRHAPRQCQESGCRAILDPLFSTSDGRPIIIVLDNASIHHGIDETTRECWLLDHKTFLFYLRAYSTELNMIGIVWRQLKYRSFPSSIIRRKRSMPNSLIYWPGTASNFKQISRKHVTSILESPMFCSRSMSLHLLRGVVALGFVGSGMCLLAAPVPRFLSLSCFAGALVLFRGCPMCWLMGLIERIARQKSKSPSSS